MRKFTLALLLGGLIGLWSCTNELASIIGSEWLYEKDQLKITLTFSERKCKAVQTTIPGAPPLVVEELYTHNPPTVTFLTPDRVERVGTFYDGYTRLVVKVNDEELYNFIRTKN